MATYFGSDGDCKVITTGGTPASVGELLSWSLTMTSDTVDTTTMGSTNRTYTAGLATGTASITAFLISELSDFFVYSKVRDKSKPLAILASGSVGSVIDSVIFLWIAFGSLAHIEGQIIGKILVTAIAALIIKYYGKKLSYDS